MRIKKAVAAFAGLATALAVQVTNSGKLFGDWTCVSCHEHAPA